MTNKEQKEMEDVFKEYGLEDVHDDKDLSSQHKGGTVPRIPIEDVKNPLSL